MRHAFTILEKDGKVTLLETGNKYEIRDSYKSVRSGESALSKQKYGLKNPSRSRFKSLSQSR